jgi:hypothetical protein
MARSPSSNEGDFAGIENQSIMFWMPDESDIWRDFGKGIVDAPDADVPRLRFAQEMERGDDASDQDRARARFIRVQLALGSIRSGHSQWMSLATEAYWLLLKYEQDWLPRPYSNINVRRPEFFRGFVECVTVPGYVLAERHDTIFSSAPIRHLDITEIREPNYMEHLFGKLDTSDSFRRILSLRLVRTPEQK